MTAEPVQTPHSPAGTSARPWALWSLIASGAGVCAISGWLFWWLNQETAASFGWTAYTPLSSEAYQSSLEIISESQLLIPQVAAWLLIVLGLGIIAMAAFLTRQRSRIRR